MKIKAIVSLLFTIALAVALSLKIGALPPLGKLMSPFVGAWQNAEPVSTSKATLTFQLQGPKGSISVTVDADGVPHVYAEHETDLYFAQGYLTAKDRLWQMEMQTRAAAGRVSEVVGEKTLEYDRFMRRIGMVFGAEASLKAMMENPVTKSILESYASGVNAWIAELSPGKLPLEYKILDYEPEQWVPLKTALLLKYMAYDLSFNNDDYELTNTYYKLGKTLTDSLFPNFLYQDSPIIPAGTPWNFKSTPPAKAKCFEPAPLELLAQSNIAKRHEKNEGIGSNNWAIAGSKTKSGRPMLANDPHLGLNLPALWYQIQLASPELNVMGASLPGAPGIIIGFNEKISWGVTNGYSDVMDWYAIQFKDSSRTSYWLDETWQPAKQRKEVYKVRGKADVVENVPYTVQGPVVYAPKDKKFRDDIPSNCAARWIAHDAANEVFAFYLINKAQQLEGFKAALPFYGSPAQNFVYADAQHTGIWASNGTLPLKAPEQGKYILDGRTSATLWKKYIPQDEKPGITDPARGYVSSANQHATDSTYPYYLNWYFASSERAIRINEILAQGSNWTVDSMIAMQNDDLNVHARLVLPTLLQELRKNQLNENEQAMLQLLSQWNYRFSAQSKAATVFVNWWNALSDTIWNDDFTYQMKVPSKDMTTHLILTQPECAWMDRKETPMREALKDVLLMALKETIQSLNTQYGAYASNNSKWEWGNVKNTKIQHLAKIPGFGTGLLYNGGSKSCINALSDKNGPSWKMVVAPGNTMEAYGIYPGGQSGNAGSKNYTTWVEDWKKGVLHPLRFLSRAQLMAGMSK